MEGYLLTPPDRGTIIGRAIWKSRYVVVGNPRQDKTQPNPGFYQVISAVRTKDGSGRASKNQPKPEPDGIYLSIYKSKEDLEPIQRHSISSITDCQVRMLSHRKQGNVLPTLAIQVSPDPATDKLRKRRSSRTAGLTTTKESGPITLWFRLGDDHTYTLVDWAKCIQDLLPQNVADKQPISPVSPGSPVFVNPFPGPPSDRSQFTRSSSGNTNRRATLSHKTSSRTYGSSQKPRTLYSSGTPSVRSLESDVSSHASSSNVGTMGYAVQQYTSIMPDDLPSPTVTHGGYQDEFIEGWTSAQGRISTLSSPARIVRGSMGSPQGPLPVGSNSSSPPLPRETILDRAFQLRCIPGSEREVPGEEKLSSLARFDALMREAEERRKAKERDQAAVKEPLKSTWEEDDSENENRDGVGEETDDEDTDVDVFDYDLNDDGNVPTNSAHRALEFIASHRSSVQSPPFRHMSRNSVSYQESHSMTSGASIARPHTSHSKLRPVIAPRTISQPQPIPLSLDRLTSTPMAPTEEGSVQRHGKRDSVSSIKRLSFNEFTKRLSGTSSLLLVQTNQSTSSRGSSEVEGLANSRGTTLSPEREDRCGWRGSVGVFGGNDGGFV